MTKRVLRFHGGGQWLLLLAVLAFAWLLAFNVHQNLANHGVTFGFGFLAQRSGFDIPFHLISWDTSSDINARALLVGVLNTLLVSAMGIVTASLLGTVVGVMRLSANWLVRTLALCFIELFRNTPVLVQITFWYVAVLQVLPSPRESIRLPFSALLNIRGIYIPQPILTPYGGLLVVFAAVLIVATPFVWRRTLGDYRVGAKAFVLPLIAAGLLFLSVSHFDLPVLHPFNVSGGDALPPELVALWETIGGLGLYPRRNCLRPRDGAADVDRERHLVLERGRQEGPHRNWPAGRPHRARPRLFLVRRSRYRRHDIGLDHRRRSHRVCRGRICRVR